MDNFIIDNNINIKIIKDSSEYFDFLKSNNLSDNLIIKKIDDKIDVEIKEKKKIDENYEMSFDEEIDKIYEVTNKFVDFPILVNDIDEINKLTNYIILIETLYVSCINQQDSVEKIKKILVDLDFVNKSFLEMNTYLELGDFLNGYL